ncbi:hypothetical protein TrVE_jg836, partial [Triparma verrucosa]
LLTLRSSVSEVMFDHLGDHQSVVRQRIVEVLEQLCVIDGDDCDGIVEVFNGLKEDADAEGWERVETKFMLVERVFSRLFNGFLEDRLSSKLFKLSEMPSAWFSDLIDFFYSELKVKMSEHPDVFEIKRIGLMLISALAKIIAHLCPEKIVAFDGPPVDDLVKSAVYHVRHLEELTLTDSTTSEQPSWGASFKGIADNAVNQRISSAVSIAVSSKHSNCAVVISNFKRALTKFVASRSHEALSLSLSTECLVVIFTFLKDENENPDIISSLTSLIDDKIDKALNEGDAKSKRNLISSILSVLPSHASLVYQQPSRSSRWIHFILEWLKSGYTSKSWLGSSYSSEDVYLKLLEILRRLVLASPKNLQVGGALMYCLSEGCLNCGEKIAPPNVLKGVFSVFEECVSFSDFQLDADDCFFDMCTTLVGVTTAASSSAKDLKGQFKGISVDVNAVVSSLPTTPDKTPHAGGAGGINELKSDAVEEKGEESDWDDWDDSDEEGGQDDYCGGANNTLKNAIRSLADKVKAVGDDKTARRLDSLCS